MSRSRSKACDIRLGCRRARRLVPTLSSGRSQTRRRGAPHREAGSSPGTMPRVFIDPAMWPRSAQSAIPVALTDTRRFP
jgi:hypothetical protein